MTQNQRNEEPEESNDEARLYKLLTSLGICSVFTAVGVVIFSVCLDWWFPAQRHTPDALTAAQIQEWAETASETATTVAGLSPVDSACVVNSLLARCVVEVEGLNRKIVTECDCSKWLCNLVGFEPALGETLTNDDDDIRSE